jgi:hypothetical protein
LRPPRENRKSKDSRPHSRKTVPKGLYTDLIRDYVLTWRGLQLLEVIHGEEKELGGGYTEY